MLKIAYEGLEKFYGVYLQLNQLFLAMGFTEMKLQRLSNALNMFVRAYDTLDMFQHNTLLLYNISVQVQSAVSSFLSSVRSSNINTLSQLYSEIERRERVLDHVLSAPRHHHHPAFAALLCGVSQSYAELVQREALLSQNEKQKNKEKAAKLCIQNALRSRSIHEERYDSEHIQNITSLLRLAEAQSLNSSKTRDSIATYNRVLELQKLHKISNFEVCATVLDLAIAYERNGDTGKALECLNTSSSIPLEEHMSPASVRKSVSHQLGMFGAEHRQTALQSKLNLIFLIHQQKNGNNPDHQCPLCKPRSRSSSKRA